MIFFDEGTVIKRDRHFMRQTHEQSQQSNVTANHDESHTEHEQPTGTSASPTDSMNLPQTDTTASSDKKWKNIPTCSETELITY